MTRSPTEAVRLPQADRDQAAATGTAEGQAAVALLARLNDDDWERPTDCAEWDVRALVSHLVAQCEDNISITTMLRRDLTRRRRYRGKTGIDGHMAVQVDDHRTETGPVLANRFAQLWPRAVQARRRRPEPLRRAKVSSGAPGTPRMSAGYLLDVIYNRDLWMHRLDLARATGHPFIIGDHDRLIVEQAMRDLALGWQAAPVTIELTGPAGGTWLIGCGDPVAFIRADATAYMRALSGRDDNVAIEVECGDETAVQFTRRARALF
jgi:uncharacterized protein (TIGR03083 family)